MDDEPDATGLKMLLARLDALEQEGVVRQRAQARYVLAVRGEMARVAAALRTVQRGGHPDTPAPVAVPMARRPDEGEHPRPPDRRAWPVKRRRAPAGLRSRGSGRERTTGTTGTTGVRVRADRGHGLVITSDDVGLQVESAGGGVYTASGSAPGVYAEAVYSDAVVASSLSANGVHAIGGQVRGGAGASPGPCGVFAEGGGGDGVYATSARIAVHGVSAAGYGASFSGGVAPLRLVPAATTGAPSEGEHRQGALLVDAAGTLWLCVASGTPGAWKQVVVRS